MAEGDRPSKHGALLGEALALIAMAGRKDFPGELPEPCLTCAFREGSQPNQTTGTGMIALNCVLGIDKDRFACHHGMKNGDPSRICVGYIAAKLAPWSFTKEVLASLQRDLDSIGDGGPDEVRAAFDAWLAGVDPKGELDVYQQARAYERSPMRIRNDPSHKRGEKSMATIGQKADYVKRQPQKRDHNCHWPGCDKQVPPAMWGCKAHWFRLPQALRNKIWTAYEPGQEIDMTPSVEYLAVAQEVQAWIAAQERR